MAERHAVGATLQPLLARRVPLGVFHRQVHQYPRQPAVCCSSLLAQHRAVAPAPRRMHATALLKLTSSRPYSSAAPYPPEELLRQAPPPKRSRTRRAVVFLFRACAYFVIGSFIGRKLVTYIFSEDEYAFLRRYEDTAEGLAEAERITQHLLTHPIVQELDADSHFHATHPHYQVPEVFRAGNVTCDTLIGRGLMAVPPLTWQDRDGQDLVMVLHVGKDLCGHPDIVHGGFVATLLDEALARCCFKAVPYEIAVTANLSINYRAPTPANSFLILRAHTVKVEGRKAVVQGWLETLPEPDSEAPGTLLAEAEGLFVSPKDAKALASVHNVIKIFQKDKGSP